MLAKFVLVVTDAKANEACGMKKICWGSEARIEGGGVHLVRLLRQQQAQEEYWRFLLIDTHNTFNEENRTAMMWALRHTCPSGLRFAFSCYHLWVTLLIRAGNRMGHFLHRKEGVTKGDPLAMIVYVIGIIPLILDLWTSHPIVTQPCYADDTETISTFAGV